MPKNIQVATYLVTYGGSLDDLPLLLTTSRAAALRCKRKFNKKCDQPVLRQVEDLCNRDASEFFQAQIWGFDKKGVPVSWEH